MATKKIYSALYNFKQFDIVQDKSNRKYTIIASDDDDWNEKIKVVEISTGYIKHLESERKVTKIDDGFKLDKNKYLKDATVCPFCGYKNALEIRSSESTAHEIRQRIICESCQNEFNEIYTLTNIER